MLCLNNKILSWDNLQKRGICGPGICFLCKEEEETISLLLGNCKFFKDVWLLLMNHYFLKCGWDGFSLEKK